MLAGLCHSNVSDWFQKEPKMCQAPGAADLLLSMEIFPFLARISLWHLWEDILYLDFQLNVLFDLVIVRSLS